MLQQSTAKAINAKTSNKANEERLGSEYLNRTAFIGGIKYSTTRDDILEYVQRFGEIESVFYPINKHTGLPKGFAKVLFAHASYLKNILKDKPHVIHNFEISISAWVPKSEFISKKEKPSINKIFVKYTDSFDFDVLERHFSQFGSLSSVDIKINYVTNLQRGIAFVIFEKQSSADAALKAGSVQSIEHRQIEVRPSKSTDDLIKESRPWMQSVEHLIMFNYHTSKDLVAVHIQATDGQSDGCYVPDDKMLQAALGRPGVSLADTSNRAKKKKLRWLIDKSVFSDSRDVGWPNHHIKPCSSKYTNRLIVGTQHSIPNLMFRTNNAPVHDEHQID